MQLTKQSSLYMAMFGTVCVGLPYVFGQVIMGSTNPEVLDREREKLLRGRASVDNQVAHTLQVSARYLIMPLDNAVLCLFNVLSMLDLHTMLTGFARR